MTRLFLLTFRARGRPALIVVNMELYSLTRLLALTERDFGGLLSLIFLHALAVCGCCSTKNEKL